MEESKEEIQKMLQKLQVCTDKNDLLAFLIKFDTDPSVMCSSEVTMRNYVLRTIIMTEWVKHDTVNEAARAAADVMYGMFAGVFKLEQVVKDSHGKISIEEIVKIAEEACNVSK